MSIVEVAKLEIGTYEFPNDTNKTKYGKWFGFDGVPWCGIFVSWCYAQAGFPLPKIGFTKGFAGCQTAVAYFKKNGMITENPVAGDIVFFDWNGDGRFDHTGIFEKWIDDNCFLTIEGNTSFLNQSNGGVVMNRERVNRNVLFVHLKK
jgi:hypothetical protein